MTLGMEPGPVEFAVESLESPALTKAQLADLLFDEIGLNWCKNRPGPRTYDLMKQALGRDA